MYLSNILTTMRMGSLGSNLTCWARQPNGIGKEGPNSGQKRATGSGISGWVGRAGVLTRSCRLALDGMSGGVKLTDDYSFTWFLTTERSEKPVNFFQVVSLSCGLNSNEQ
jgi:hypothetical protein